jgi:peptidoglycan/LPS O-acetylase OafA/YrhL
VALYILSIIYYNYFLYQDNYRFAKQLPGAYAFFAAGILFYKKFDFFFKWKHYIILPSLLFFVIEQYVFSVQFLKPITYGFMVYYLAYTLRFFNNFGKYGDFTYGIYIYHFPVIQVFVALGLFMMYSPLLMFVCTAILVLFLAVLSWVFIELPFLPPSRRNRHKQIFKSSFKY